MQALNSRASGQIKPIKPATGVQQRLHRLLPKQKQKGLRLFDC
jgi:hypothetical protein